MVFVPVILVSGLILGTRLKAPESILETLPIDPLYYKYMNLGVLTSLFYCYYYLSLDLFFGVLASPGIIYAGLKGTTYLDGAGKEGIILLVVVQAVSWIAQFIGHGAFEHRAPALLDNLNQALLLAPLFVLFEYANLFGFRKDVMAKVDELVRPEVEQFRAERAAVKR